ncbi:unnamed protein product [Periconia digitata]|uniref:Uncharacterized protein n=1 Tax=Periconia digitata TaxID=1303443 RepID=A0A9W4U9W5_9PLEO|nr:unnamed protein product [Periconia digitata]
MHRSPARAHTHTHTPTCSAAPSRVMMHCIPVCIECNNKCRFHDLIAPSVAVLAHRKKRPHLVVVVVQCRHWLHAASIGA